MTQSHPFIRNFTAGEMIEIFFVSAVFAVLAIRFYLQATGYPQIGGADLHIAHMLWGGLLMMVAMIVQFGFLSEEASRLAATLGGLGFGTFIDEIGKFVTHDNNYFFEPAISLIYVTFILAFIFARTLNRSSYRPDEYLSNSIEALRQAAQHDLDPEEQALALAYLNQSDPAHPMVTPLRRLLEEAPLVPPAPGPFTRVKRTLRDHYRVVVLHRWYQRGLVLFFVGQFLVRLALVFAILNGWRAGTSPHWSVLAKTMQEGVNLGFVGWSQLGSTLFSGFLVLVGIFALGTSNLSAYLWWKRSILVTLLITQVFVFYTDQLSGLLGLAFNALLLIGLGIAIDRERERSRNVIV